MEDFLCCGAVVACMAMSIYLLPVIVLLFLYIILHTSTWWLLIPYFYWICVFDMKTPERGGRLLQCLVNLKLFIYVKNYFPVKIVKTSEHELDPSRNYLFVSFPHGAFGTGSAIAFASTLPLATEAYPLHKPTCIILSSVFYIPILRDLALFLGYCSSSKESLTYLLSKPGGGNIVCLVAGGIKEMQYCYPNKYKFVLKNRKGFIKIALKTGSPLLPVIVFGENDIYYGQLDHPIVRKLQIIFKNITSFFPIVVIGRFFLPFFPRKTPINFVGTYCSFIHTQTAFNNYYVMFSWETD